jgi:hypothetical protein
VRRFIQLAIPVEEFPHHPLGLGRVAALWGDDEKIIWITEDMFHYGFFSEDIPHYADFHHLLHANFNVSGMKSEC